jgi:4-amino-4-deoxy-L-arabinose transferase-like glycosyltransferase
MNNIESKSFNNRNILWLIFITLLVIIFFCSMFRYYDHDEFEAIHTSWKIIHGERIFIDFFQQKNPFFHYTLIPILKLFGETIVAIKACRFFIFITMLCSLTVIYFTAKTIFDSKVAIISLILTTSTYIFVQKSIEIRPDTIQVLFGIIGVFFLYEFFKNNQTVNLIMSGISLGISFLFLQKAILIIALLGIILIYRYLTKQIKIKYLILFSVTIILTILPYYIYLFSRVSLKTYWICNWFINVHFIETFSPVKVFILSFKQNIFLWSFYLFGLVIVFKEKTKNEIAFLSLGLLGLVFGMRNPNSQYFMMAMPFVAMIAAFGICKIFDRKTKLQMILLILIAVLASGNFCYVSMKHNNREQLEKIEYVLSITDNDDYVYDGNIQFNVFRKDLDYFWYSLRPTGVLATYKQIVNYDYDFYKLLQKYKPKVISNYYVDTNIPIIMGNYSKSFLYKDIYIRNN